MANPRRVARLFLRVPWRDWSAVVTGEKRMLRQPIQVLGLSLVSAPRPSPVIGFTVRPRISAYENAMLVLEAYRHEPLGAISPADLEAEGFDSLTDFRRYWIARHPTGRGFDPLMTVAVCQVRPWEPDDAAAMGDVLLRHLYGEWLPAPVEAA